MSAFAAWIVRDKGAPARLEELGREVLPSRDVTVRVDYSGINYKDALALHGRPGVIRAYPLICGIDLAGTVLESADPRWSPGDVVVLNGAGLGEEQHGGLAALAAVSGDDLVAVPEPFTPAQAAAIGTAGFTAALGVLAMERAGLAPEQGPVLVTGSGGGVGSIAIALLARAGYDVAALTGRPGELRDQLTRLGAARIIGRDELGTAGRPLGRATWAGVADAVGGPVLAAALATLKPGGVATACGLAAGAAFEGNVMPFILRGVSLLGIDSVRCPRERREAAWGRLARDLDPGLLDSVTRTVPLAGAADAAASLLAGQGTGRTVVAIG